MNYSTAVFLINDKVRAVMATYEAEPNAARTMFKTLDETLKVDDFAVVPTDTRHKMTVVKIVEVDCDVDFDSPTQMKWIISRVDRELHEEVLAQEATAIEAVQSAEKQRRKDELRKAMIRDHEERFKTLAIANVSDAAEGAAPPAAPTE